MISNKTFVYEKINIGYEIFLIFIPVAFMCIAINLYCKAKSQILDTKNYEQL